MPAECSSAIYSTVTSLTSRLAAGSSKAATAAADNRDGCRASHRNVQVSSADRHLFVVDVSQPDQPTLVTRVNGTVFHDLQVRSQPVVAPDNLLVRSPFLIGPDALFDRSDPRQPALVATGSVDGELDVEGDLLGVVSNRWLHFFRIRSSPPGLEPLASHDLLGVNRDVRIVGPHALVANESRGILVLDVRDPTQAKLGPGPPPACRGRRPHPLGLQRAGAGR